MPKELTPTFTVISKACDGDETAISKILEFYDPYINRCCMRPFYDDNNNLRLAVDLEMKGFIKEAIIRKILNFDIKKEQLKRDEFDFVRAICSLDGINISSVDLTARKLSLSIRNIAKRIYFSVH